jgi:hypothetical protein
MPTWILWFVFVSAGDVWSVPLDRYDTKDACETARVAAELYLAARDPEAVSYFLCVKSQSR